MLIKYLKRGIEIISKDLVNICNLGKNPCKVNEL